MIRDLWDALNDVANHLTGIVLGAWLLGSTLYTGYSLYAMASTLVRDNAALVQWANQQEAAKKQGQAVQP